MTQNNQKEQLIKISNWISPRLEQYESIIFLILVATLLLRITTDLPLGILIALLLIVLSIMYFFNAFSITEDEYAGGIEQFIYKLTAISESIGIMGILFTLQGWPGSDKMLLIGCGYLLVSLPVIYFFKFKKPELKIYSSRMILRIFLISVLGLALYFTPVDILTKTGLVKEVKIEVTE